MVDHTLFYKRDDDDITSLIGYVDNIIVTCSNSTKIKIKSF